MSEKFEAEVLKMFGKIDSRLGNIEHTLDEHSRDIKELKATVSENTKDIKELKAKVEELKTTTKENSIKIKGLKESLDVHNKFFIRYENEFSKKLQVLFDFVSMAEEKHTMYDDINLHYNSKFLNHDIRISALEDLLKEKTKIATA